MFSVFDEDTVCGFIGVITYAVADMQCSKSFFTLPGEKTGRKSRVAQESMYRLLMTNSAHGSFQEISR